MSGNYKDVKVTDFFTAMLTDCILSYRCMARLQIENQNLYVYVSKYSSSSGASSSVRCK